MTKMFSTARNFDQDLSGWCELDGVITSDDFWLSGCPAEWVAGRGRYEKTCGVNGNDEAACMT